jgi:hypothetical protein
MMAVAMMMIKAAAPATEPTMTGRLDEAVLEVPGELVPTEGVVLVVVLMLLLVFIGSVVVPGGGAEVGMVEVLIVDKGVLMVEIVVNVVVGIVEMVVTVVAVVVSGVEVVIVVVVVVVVSPGVVVSGASYSYVNRRKDGIGV